MRRIWIVIALIVIAKISVSQEFPDSCASWFEVVVDHSYSGVQYTFSKLEVGGKYDTIVRLGKTYHKVYLVSGESKTIKSYYRVEGKKVYLWEFSNQEKVLYDFSLKEGDTFVNTLGTALIVTKVDSVLINNHYRTRYYFDPPIYGAFWVNGIGSSRGLLGSAEPIPTCKCDYQREMVCFYKGDTLIYHNPDYYSCSSKTDYVDIVESSKIRLFPNPVVDKSYLDFKIDGKKEQRIDFYNMNGVLIKSEMISNQELYAIDRNDFVKGIYFFCIFFDDNSKAEGKFVVQ